MDTPVDMSVGIAVRYLRERAGLSARQLSLAAGLSPAYVGRLEAGELAPSLQAFARLAMALRMTPTEICTLVRSAGSAMVSHPSSTVGDDG